MNICMHVAVVLLEWVTCYYRHTICMYHHGQQDNEIKLITDWLRLFCFGTLCVNPMHIFIINAEMPPLFNFFLGQIGYIAHFL